MEQRRVRVEVQGGEEWRSGIYGGGGKGGSIVGGGGGRKMH